jgi:hypothetical protein
MKGVHMDRTRDPCRDCGEELYDKYYGNGGWAPTEKSTDRTHGPSDCVKRLKAELTVERCEKYYPEASRVEEVRSELYEGVIEKWTDAYGHTSCVVTIAPGVGLTIGDIDKIAWCCEGKKVRIIIEEVK